MIIIHEIGHLVIAIFFGTKDFKILIYPLGGISKFVLPLNISIWSEFLILVFGPIFQMFGWFILCFLFPEFKEIISFYNFGILLFNLLPIYPLDGGKIVCLICHLFLSYCKAFYLAFGIGYIFLFLILLIFFNTNTFNLLFIFIFLTIKLSKEFKNVSYSYERFLLERYLKTYYFKKSKIVKNSDQFQRNYRHLIKDGDNYCLEREYLEKKYKNC